MASSRKRMNVISLSFDDCVYHPHYDLKFEEAVQGPNDNNQAPNPFDGKPNTDFDRLTEANQPLIQSLANAIKAGGFKEVTWMLGCGRQDFVTSEERMRKTGRGSCFEDLPEIGKAVKQKLVELNTSADAQAEAATDIPFRLDKYLLADSYGILANFDLAEVSIQDDAAYYEGEAAIARGAATQALRSAKTCDEAIAEANSRRHAYPDEARQSRGASYLDDVNAKKRRDENLALAKSVARWKEEAKALRQKAEASVAEAERFSAQAKQLRRRPYGYGINADDALLNKRRKKMVHVLQSSVKTDRDIQSAMDVDNLDAAAESDHVKAILDAHVEKMGFDPIVYARSMRVGDSWNAILVEREIKQLRQKAEPHLNQAKIYLAKGHEFNTPAREAYVQAEKCESLALGAIASGKPADDAHAWYTKQDEANKRGDYNKSFAVDYYDRAIEQKKRAQEYLDVANILSLGPYVKSVAEKYAKNTAVNYRTPSEAIYAAGYDPHKEHLHQFHHPTSFVDDSRLTLLYAQMHKAASENPENEIVFDFYHGSREILLGLANFFRRNPDLMPGNLQLRLHHYHGDAPRLVMPIHGRGPIDYNFHDNIRLMIECAGFTFINDYHGNAPNHPTPDCPDVGVLVGFWVQENLAAFKKQRQYFSDAVNFRQKPYLPGTFDPKVYLHDLYTEIENFPEDALHAPLKHALGNLYEELENACIDQARRGVTPYKIERSATKEMADMTRAYLQAFKTAQPADRLEVTERFVKRYQSMSRLRNVGKTVAVILAAIMGMVVGAAIGISIGFAAGLVTGPGAVVTGLVGMVAGASAGTIAGITAGSVLAGVGGGLAAKFYFFGVRPDGKTIAMREVVSAARAYVKAAPAPVEVRAERVDEAASSSEASKTM